MKHGKNTLRLTALLTAALMLLLTLCGCSRGMIREDSVHEDLPDIDPEAGIAKDMRAKLYYRLTDEAYLVGVTATITVYAGEREDDTHAYGRHAPAERQHKRGHSRGH